MKNSLLIGAVLGTVLSTALYLSAQEKNEKKKSIGKKIINMLGDM